MWQTKLTAIFKIFLITLRIFIELSKTFNTVNHKILIFKVENYEFKYVTFNGLGALALISDSSLNAWR